jgi:glycerophosphodiester phosphodiesterase
MNAASISPGIKRVSSVVRIGCPEPDAILLDEYIVADQSVQLAKHFNSLSVFGKFDDVLVKLLQRAISVKSLNCVEVLLSRVTTLQESSDLNRRNILHKYIVNFGRSIATSLPPTPDSEHTDEGLFITPAVSPRASSPTRVGRPSKPEERLDDTAFLKILLERTPIDLRSSLIARDLDGRTPLHYTAFYGLYKGCELVAHYMREWNLLRDPVRWDEAIWQDNEGLTPLHLAVMGSHKLTLKALLDAEKQDPFSSTIRTVVEESLLIVAVKEHSAEIAKLLIQADMDLNFQDSNGETC